MGREIGWTDFTTPTAVFLSLYYSSSTTVPLIVKETYDLFPSVEYDKSDTLIKSWKIYIKDIYLSIYKIICMCVCVYIRFFILLPNCFPYQLWRIIKRIWVVWSQGKWILPAIWIILEVHLPKFIPINPPNGIPGLADILIAAFRRPG